MTNVTTTVRLTSEDRTALIALLMFAEPARWANPPRDLIERLVGKDAAEVVLSFRFKEPK